MPQKTRENYTRVTTILYPFSGLQNIDADIVARAANRGTRVHKVCEGIVRGLGELGVDDEIRGYVDSFKAWWQEGQVPVEIEKRFWCDKHEITGQVDFILKTEDGLAIVDLKTSAQQSKTWQVQGSAYAYLAQKSGYDISKIFFVKLSKTGKKPTVYEYQPDKKFFLAVLSVYNYFFKKEAT